MLPSALCTQHPFDSLVSGAHRTNEPRHDCSWSLASPRPVTVVQVNRQFPWLAWNLQHYPDGYLAWALFLGSQLMWEIESPEEKVCRGRASWVLLVTGQENGLLFSTSSWSAAPCQPLYLTVAKGRSRWVITFSHYKLLIRRRNKQQRAVFKTELLTKTKMQQPHHLSANVGVSVTRCMQKTTCLCHLQDIHMTLTPV